MYTIVESGTNGIEPVKSYEDLEKHHPSKAREPKREYDETDGHLEEIRTNEPGGRRLVKKDFVLLVNGSNKSIDVPCPVAGFVKTFKSYGTVKIYSTEKYDDLLGQVLHLDTNFKVKDGQYVEYGQPIGIQYRTDGEGKPTYAIHTHAELERTQFEKYIKDIVDGNIKPGTWPSNTSSTDDKKYQFPIRKVDGNHYTLEELYKELEKEKSGHYILGNNGFWHGGIHFSDASVPHAKLKQAVRCMADGEVVAYRLNKDYLSSTFMGEKGCDNLRYSTSFCLVRHTYESQKRPAESKPAAKIEWVGKTVQLISSRYGRDIASTVLGNTGNFEALMPAGTELQILKIHDTKDMRFALATIKTALPGKDRAGNPVTRAATSEIWFAAFDKQDAILKDRNKQAIFKDVTPAPPAEAKTEDKKPETNKLEFFSLYMHLLPFEHYPLQDGESQRRFKVKVKGRNVRKEANLTGTVLGQIDSGAEFELISITSGHQIKPGDTATYELAQIKILSKGVKKSGVQTAKEGDVVWMAISKAEPGKTDEHYAEEIPPQKRIRPTYWKGQVKAQLKKRVPAFNKPEDPVDKKIGLLAENTVLEYASGTVKRVIQAGRPQIMAPCTIVSGGFWDTPMCPSGPIWVVIDTDAAELKPDVPSDFDSVVTCAIPIKAGDPIGYLGLYETLASAKGGVKSRHQVHVELFSTDPNLEAFLKNPAGLKDGKQYLRVAKGKTIYNKGGTAETPTFTPSGLVINENYLIAASQAKLFKAPDSKEWYPIKVNSATPPVDGYIAKADGEIISQHDREKLGFQIIKESNDNADGFLDPKEMPDFFQNLYLKIDQLGNKDDKVTADEISLALKNHKLRDRWSKLIGYHPTEWQAKSSAPKWQRLEELLEDVPEVLRHEKERIDNLVFWDELAGTMQVALPKQVHHFHPLSFIDTLTIQKAESVVMEGQITFDAEGNDIPGSPYYSRVIHWPGNDLSGVTLGRGYDMGTRSESEIYNHMISSGIDNTQAGKISKAHGLKGVNAHQFVTSNKNDIGEITYSQQVSLFKIIYPDYVARAITNYNTWTSAEPGRVEWTGLKQVIRDILTDFVYQGFTKGPNPMKAGMNNDIDELIRYIENTPAISQYEPGRRRAKYLRNHR
ncbi:hypothetical protein [Pseudomonas peli]|uniref:hypothetical protein n=1 Tax=Pseudomonas peli TaxID=592361 RepID=UPI00285D2FF2|nr:hypothetical protein [Pseudomonas peli]MDR7024045.1 hypothetical protein [Pseudomonas peli]